MEGSMAACAHGVSDDDKILESKQVPGGSLRSKYCVYTDDVVCLTGKEGVLGVISEIPGDSESDSSDSDEDEDEGGEVHGDDNKGGSADESGSKNDSIEDGQARILWLDGTETISNLADLTVVDRAFLHGDIVSSITNPTGQLGMVGNVNIIVDLVSPDGELIKNVSSRELKRFRKFSIGDYVVFGHWLGRVDDIVENVTVLFDDGSVCKVPKADPSRLKPVSKSIVDNSGSPYYPGQRVRAASSSVFKGSRWLSGFWKAKRRQGTILKVELGSVFIYWIATSNPGEGANLSSVPSEEQNPKDLTLLSCFSHANWQLGLHCLLAGSITKDNENCIDECKSEADKFDKDLIAENGKVDDGHMCNQLKNDHSINALPAQKQNGTSNLDESTVCTFEESDTEEKIKTEDCSSSPESKSYTGTSPSSSSSSKEPHLESWPSYRKKLRRVFFKREKKGHKKIKFCEEAFLIVNIMTKVDVAWQDGTKDYDVESKLLVPINSPGDQEFFQEQYVVEKVLNESDISEKPIGIVKSMNSKERIACIRWLKPVTRPDELREFGKEEMVSVYELDIHPDYDYCYGDVVVRLLHAPPISACSGTSIEKQEDHIDETENPNKTDTSNDLCHVDNCLSGGHDIDACDLSWVGQITGLDNGDIEVTWGDGMISRVGPQAIYVVGREDQESSDDGSECSDWETVEEDDSPTEDISEEVSDLPQVDNCKKVEDGTGSHPEDTEEVQGPLSTAINFVANIASGLFYQGKKHTDLTKTKERSLDVSGVRENLDFHVKANDILMSNPPKANGLSLVLSECASADAFSPKPLDTVLEENGHIEHKSKEVCGEISVNNKDGLNCFKHFDIIQCPLDNYFIGTSAIQIGGRKKWVKKVQQDWSILEKNLPDEIYVRVFEDRMDILRAVIVGASGTPYQDGLFFFDFHLPQEYPEVPPSAYYHSGGLRVNPNLYENGKVCLSLLNTWSGKGNEVWDPSSSSILQVLVSIQGLVLNSKPYFNEAGYEKQIGTVEGEKNYLPYNENTFLLNLKSMMYLLKRPPMHFEDFTKDHFRKRGHYILKACNAYMNGCLVGSLTEDASMNDASGENSCSIGFKLMLNKILPMLFSALCDIGVDCQQFEHLLKS